MGKPRYSEAASHISSTVKGERNECMRACLFFSACCAQLHFTAITQFMISCLGNGAAYSGLDPPVLIDFIKAVFHRHADNQPNANNPSLRLFSQVIIGCVTMTIKVTTLPVQRGSMTLVAIMYVRGVAGCLAFSMSLVCGGYCCY